MVAPRQLDPMPRLSVGQVLPRVVLRDQRGDGFDLENMEGKPLVLFYYLQNGLDACNAQLQAFQQQLDAFRALGVPVIGISPDSPESHHATAQALGLMYPLLSDHRFIAARDLGVSHTVALGPKEAVKIHRTTVVLDAALRVRRVYRPSDPVLHVTELLRDIPSILPELDPKPASAHAPVLLIPQVFEQGLCEHLVAEWDRSVQQALDTRRAQVGPEYKRRDLNVAQLTVDLAQETMSHIDRRLMQRVVPVMQHALQYQPTRREAPVVFGSDVGGQDYDSAARADERSEHQHRRFCLRINLSPDNYEGGELRFPEYGGCLYRPQWGDAMVYSAALLMEHGVVSAGRQCQLVTYFYNEDDAQARDKRSRHRGGLYRAGSQTTTDDPIF